MEEKNKILSTMNSPLVFFALALLIVEGFLTIVLTVSNLDALQKYTGMWAGISLFVILIIIVTLFVWCKPENLIFKASDHLESKRGERSLSPDLSPKKSEIISQKNQAQKMVSTKKIEKTSNAMIKIINKNRVALIEYKVDQVLPGTVAFDLLKDKKVWFWIANLENKKYLAYIKIKLKVGNYEKEFYDKYYGGKEPWKLNALTGIHAPGMGIWEIWNEADIEGRIKKGEQLDITINCEVKDEENKLVEKKLPVTYRYSAGTNTWYLEP